MQTIRSKRRIPGIGVVTPDVVDYGTMKRNPAGIGLDPIRQGNGIERNRFHLVIERVEGVRRPRYDLQVHPILPSGNVNNKCIGIMDRADNALKQLAAVQIPRYRGAVLLLFEDSGAFFLRGFSPADHRTLALPTAVLLALFPVGRCDHFAAVGAGEGGVLLLRTSESGELAKFFVE